MLTAVLEASLGSLKLEKNVISKIRVLETSMSLCEFFHVYSFSMCPCLRDTSSYLS